MGTNSHRKRKFWILFLILWLVPTVIVVLVTVVLPLNSSPLRQVASEPVSTGEAMNKTESKQPENGPWRPLYDSLMEMRLQETFLQNRLELSKSDSIGLIVDLIDSLLNLEIKGVVVRSTKIDNFEVSDAIEELREKQRLLEWLSGPFILMEESATVPKAPIKIKEAPEDTIEAELTSSIDTTAMPDEFHDIHFRLLFDRHLVVTIHQNEITSSKERWRKWKYNGSFLLRRAREAVAGMFGSKSTEPDLFVDLTLTREDCKAIYRALPENTKLVLRL